MADALHRGVNEADERNRGIIEHFRPKDVTPEYVRARFARVVPHETPAQIEARIAKFMADLASKPHRPPPPLSQSPDQVADARYGLGTHPDLVELLWQLDRELPQSCRWVVWGYPALVHPKTGVVFAVGFGTIGIVLRLPPELGAAASSKRALGRGQEYDLSSAGPEWRFLPQQAQDQACRAAYDFAGLPPA